MSIPQVVSTWHSTFHSHFSIAGPHSFVGSPNNILSEHDTKEGCDGQGSSADCHHRATRGLGRALVEEFHAGGHVVVGCGRDAAEIAKLNETFGSHAAVPLFTALDVTDSAGVLAWAERVVKQYGPPDLLINNAAVINRPAPAWTFSADEFARLMNVNVNGVLNSVRAFARQ